MVKSKATLVFAITSFLISGCSVNKANQGHDLSSSDSENSSASVEPGSIGPISKSGSSLALISTQTGERVIIAKEYRHKVFDRYFITTRSEDQKIVEPGGFLGADWESTSNTYSLYESQILGSSPLCRFYIPATKTHFYTADVDECRLFKGSSEFRDEGIEGYAINIGLASSCSGVTKPVYRAFYNTSIPEQRRHRYSANPDVISNLVSHSWQNEGISFCVDNVFLAPTPTAPPVDLPPTSSCVKPDRFSNLTRDPCEDFGPFPSDLAAYCACRFSTTPPNPTPTPGPTPTPPSPTPTPPVDPTPVATDPSQCPSDYLFYDWGTMNGSSRYTGTSSADLFNHSVTDRGLTGARQTVVFKLTVPASTTTTYSPSLPALVTVEEPGYNQIEREFVISRNPCNFLNPEFIVMKPSDHSQGGYFKVRFNEPKQRSVTSGNAQDKIHLTTGVWYITIRNLGAESSIYGVNDKTNLMLGIQSWKNGP